MLKISTATANALANAIGLKDQLDAGFLFLFAGLAPESADTALDMVNVHTEIAKFSVDDDGITGLTFDAPAGGLLSKAVLEAWLATTAFDGFESAELSLTPTFFRFCAAGDNGRGAAHASTGYRLQGTVGSLSSGADMEMGETSLAEAVELPINSFGIRIGQAP